MQYPEAKSIIKPPQVFQSKLMTSLRGGVDQLSSADLPSAVDDLEHLLWAFQRSLPDGLRENSSCEELKRAFVERLAEL